MGRSGSRKWTLILIRDVNRPIWRTKFPRFLLPLLPTSIALLVITIIFWQVHIYRGLTTEITVLNRHIEWNRLDYEYELELKEDTILQLQTDLLNLSEKAARVEQELDGLRKLEEELRDLSGLPEVPVGPFSVEDDPNKRLGSVGGTSQQATQEQIDSLTREIEQAMEASRARMSELSLALSEVKASILQHIHVRNHTPSIWPVHSREVTSSYGFRRDPFTGKAQFHHGIDIAGNTNDAVLATADGVVEAAGSDAQKGNFILINHGFGIRTQYMHLNKALVKKGDEVIKGEEIGKMGSTGRSTGPHLHYEVHVNRKEVNPAPYMKEANEPS